MDPQHPAARLWDLVQHFDPTTPPSQGIDHHGAFDLSDDFAGLWGPEQWAQRCNVADSAGHRDSNGRRRRRRHHGKGDANTEDDSHAGARDGGSVKIKDELPAEGDRADAPDAPGATGATELCQTDAYYPPGIGPCRRGPGARGTIRGGFGSCPVPHEHQCPTRPSGSEFDLAWLRGTDHPFFHHSMRECRGSKANPAAVAGSDIFVPPVDVFTTERAFVLHMALPGGKKEDLGVNWNPENSTLSIAGVVRRQGDDGFLRALTYAERKVGAFERCIRLPPAGSSDREDVDGLAITAKMENGILVVTVPKMEKEWTEIRKVDIE